ncbi:hypothetical protein MAPG_09063 [Magnaporthiopsis poae ATCC 64411]|uniref:Uncharacterized protein n=1 Tax=Magnaporthiopsis poae (strain ATCC 64411 / 73-15) TaxID=644358 RepID=A0A0C4E8Z1_MAGP6|nr:hypothetical protein MAPG_09063 [Magnaporthiopsis poae ATCC 64411]
MAVVTSPGVNPRRPRDRYGAVLVPVGEEWRLRTGEPDGHQRQHQHQHQTGPSQNQNQNQTVARTSPGKTGDDERRDPQCGPVQSKPKAPVVMRSRPLSKLQGP